MSKLIELKKKLELVIFTGDCQSVYVLILCPTFLIFTTVPAAIGGGNNTTDGCSVPGKFNL